MDLIGAYRGKPLQKLVDLSATVQVVKERGDGHSGPGKTPSSPTRAGSRSTAGHVLQSIPIEVAPLRQEDVASARWWSCRCDSQTVVPRILTLIAWNCAVVRCMHSVVGEWCLHKRKEPKAARWTVLEAHRECLLSVRGIDTRERSYGNEDKSS